MRAIAFLFFLLCTQANAQKIALEICINSVISSNADPKIRMFTINYHLANLTAEAQSVFLDTTEFITSTRSSMSNKPHYKIYQNNEFIEADDILKNKDQLQHTQEENSNMPQTAEEKDNILRKTLRETMDVDLDSARAAYATSEQAGLKYMAQKYGKVTLKRMLKWEPYETKHFSQIVYWDKKRYYAYEQYEYYLEQKDQYYMDLTIIPLREYVKGNMTEEQYSKLLLNHNLVEGVFSSNKIAIDFKD